MLGARWKPISSRIVIGLFVVLVIFLIHSKFNKSNSSSIEIQHQIWIKYAQNDRQGKCALLVDQRNDPFFDRLSVFASAYGLSLTHQCDLMISVDVLNELKKVFMIDIDEMKLVSNWQRQQPKEPIKNICSFYTTLFQPNTPQYIELMGTWSVFRYFSNYTNEIRQQLKVQSNIIERVQQFFRSAFTKKSIVVAVHIPVVSYEGFRASSSNSYIVKSMTYFKQKYPSSTFLVITNNKLYCKRVLKFDRRNDVIFTPESFSDNDDLVSISLCDHAIITFGSLGWWGAFLLRNQDGEIITDVGKDFSPIHMNCHKEDYFPPWFRFLNEALNPKSVQRDTD